MFQLLIGYFFIVHWVACFLYFVRPMEINSFSLVYTDYLLNAIVLMGGNSVFDESQSMTEDVYVITVILVT